MNTIPNTNYSGAAGYVGSQYSLNASQQQQVSTLPALEQQLSPGGVGVPIVGGSSLPSFQLASVATSPIPGTPSSAATGSAAMTGLGGGFAFSQSIVSPSAPSVSSTFNDYSANPHPSYNYQQQPMPKLVNVPVTQSYSYQPSTHNTQEFPNVLLNGGPINGSNALPMEETQGQAVSQQNAGIQKSKPRAPRNKSKFKRFRNAFIYFVNDQRDKVDDETKKLKNREFLQLMSARWKTMPEIERKPYVHLAEEDKKRFNEDVKKFGKYESRQRRYNKPRTLSKSGKYAYPQEAAYGFPASGNSTGSMGTGQSSGGAAAAAANFLYTAGGGYGNVVPAQMSAGAAPQTNISQFYVGPPAQSSSANARLGTLAASNLPHSGTSILAADIQQQIQQPSSSLLTPPAATDAQRRSISSNNSSNANEVGDINTSLSPGYQWASAAAAGNAQTGMIPHGRYYAAYYQQQQQPPASYLQVPAGIPITHSLTEPAFQMTGHQNPLLVQNQQQTQHQTLQQQQY
ncbi:hypothetical protein IW140_001901 [Coemansia sp. RSA 1813]|nr:Non-histone chromosomal protein 6 [Coemansia sp. RSA 1646]KAJ1769916.1 hypothetical protein LPJ74_003637 [Coemansia sp. RSA 1843]KAJ2087254.1 hypothetical protein IW138_005100 [Coemansia sp. RSA 986]KAJ2212085.1 hypothetical protein EV179_004947 [Coemansia sp. RSA 487]KAJ2570947.1 hypothetical protein IW140_001901 [Coemansia sp. RSA 1813]